MLKDTNGVNGRLTKIQKDYQTRQYLAGSLDTIIRETKEKSIAEWAARRKWWICEEGTDDKNYFKVIAVARLKLEKETAPVVACIEEHDRRGEPQAVATSIDGQIQERAGACRKVK